ncbi:hypothetical protein [uncultured Hymenobacter sp.]|uniref:hypothetical protein n=1 Tax=uncultured Hymenobacter sp. TaxID=170016 RepID=UPI0035CAB6E8
MPPSPVLARIAAALLRVLTSAPAMTAALVFMSNNSRDDPGYKSEWDFGRLSQVPTDKDRARLAYLEAEREHRALTSEEDELVTLLAVVRKVHLGGPTFLPIYYAEQARITAEARAMDANRNGHSYAEHGAHVTPAQHETRLRTGRKPSGVTPVKPDGTSDIPTKSASFESDAKHLETLRLADRQLQTEKINSKGELKKKVV